MTTREGGGVAVRHRTPADLDACAEALALVHAADRYPVDWPGDPQGWLTPHGLLRAWVAYEDGRVLGHVGLADTPEGPEVTRLFVAPAARGRGLAPLLLATVREAAGTPVLLEVSHEGRAAIALYERLGWRRVRSSRARWLNAAGEPALLHHYVSP
ncbi:GNAT family N-acetyltransferase [Nonomuraea sp. WAC 01424]|uniref:GNAT family N-acetyltransferase n=1 Tax=Nonomuraea sp. WAC 01424 TaxID=2203200 RepID=UPI001C8C82C3|nr:GNAT family N-acetyltransferase [Nonomuraea sp. WAC 01424]